MVWRATSVLAYGYTRAEGPTSVGGSMTASHFLAREESTEMPDKPRTSPVIRATLTAMDTVNGLRDARLDAARDDAERERVQTEQPHT
jgi:hypothetical protein